MKILLINPLFPPSIWDFSRVAHLTGKRYAHPPLSLPTIAALCPQECDVTIVDENVEDLPAVLSYDLVGITGYYIQRDRVFEIADYCRGLGLQVALGGPLVNAKNAQDCLEHADAIFVGEAEYTWPSYLATLLAGGQPRSCYVQENFIDMVDSPTPRFDLLKLERYTTTTIETSRGCPQRCEFCEIPTRLGGKSRTKSVDQVLIEVETLVGLGADSIFFVDDHFVGNRARTIRLLEELANHADRTPGLYFSCQFTINYARDAAIVDHLRRARFRRVFIGIETPRKASLLAVGKKQNVVGDLVESVRALHRAGILVWAGMILGFDTDDEASFDEMIDFLDAAALPIAMIGLLNAIPNTPLFDRMERAGRVRTGHRLGGVRGTQQDLLVSNIDPICMPEIALIEGYQRVLSTFYDPAEFGARLVRAIETELPTIAASPRVPVSLNDVTVLARVVRHFLLHRDARMRSLFLRVFGWTAFHRPERLQVAILHLVSFVHMRSFFDEVAGVDAAAFVSRAVEHPRRVSLPICS